MQKNLRVKAEVWSQPNCPACTEAKRLLNNLQVSIKECMIGVNGYTKKDLLDKVPHARSVPQIFLDDKYIGGLQELKQELANDNYKNTGMV